MSRITLWGFYNFTDKTLFDGAVMPEGIERQELVDLIMIECGDLYPYYQQPNYLQMQINNFFKRKKFNFDKMIAALNAEYDPLENYDRKEDWSDTFEEHVEGEANDETSSDSDGTSTSKISAMDSDALVDDTQGISHNEGTSKAKTTNAADRNNEGAHTGRVHGNIGVTTSMQLIKEELELRKFDVMEQIVRAFEKDIIVQIY